MEKYLSQKLFRTDDSDGFFELIYSSENGMKAHEIGDAILGMNMCFVEVAKVTSLKNAELIIFPIEKGSLKLRFKVIAPVAISIAGTIALISDSLNIIQFFGSNRVFHPDKEVLSSITDSRILAACANKNMIDGSRKIVSPLDESTQNVEIRYDKNGIVINCNNKDKFFEDIKEVAVLPELKNGDHVSLAGEIVRLNKEYNDLGFKYKNRTLKCVPLDKNGSISQFHNFIEDDQVIINGIIIRNNESDIPQIQILSIHKISEMRQGTIFND